MPKKRTSRVTKRSKRRYRGGGIKEDSLRVYFMGINRFIVTICDMLEITEPSHIYAEYLEDLERKAIGKWNGSPSKTIHDNMLRVFN